MLYCIKKDFLRPPRGQATALFRAGWLSRRARYCCQRQMTKDLIGIQKGKHCIVILAALTEGAQLRVRRKGRRPTAAASFVNKSLQNIAKTAPTAKGKQQGLLRFGVQKFIAFSRYRLPYHGLLGKELVLEFL